MDFSGDYEAALKELRNNIARRLNLIADRIIQEETAKIMGRVKIVTSRDLNSPHFWWFIEGETK